MTELNAPSHSLVSRTPAWALQPAKEFLDYLLNSRRILHLAMRGIAMIQKSPEAIELIQRIENTLRDTSPEPIGEEVDADAESSGYERRLEFAKQEADLARREVENSFPMLHAQFVVSLWGNLVSHIHGLLAAWLMNEPIAMQVAQVQKLRVPLGEYEALDREERAYLILDLLERDVPGIQKPGISRFESLLEIFGLVGKVDDTTRKSLLELNQVRNVLVHRRGLVDRKLLLACPWLTAKVGDSVIVTHQDYARYWHAVDHYVTEVMTRVAVHFGTPREELDDLAEPPDDGDTKTG